METSTKNITIRWTSFSDIKEVMDILFRNDNDMTKKELIALIHKYTLRCAYDGTHGIAIGVIGYKIKTPEVEIVMFYAHPDYDVTAVMSTLLEKLTMKLYSIPPAARKLFFWVPELELDTQLFLKDNKFKAIRVVDDKYLMERTK